jgi:hypothetical protein
MATYLKYEPWVDQLCNKIVDAVGAQDTFKAIIHTDDTALTSSLAASCTQIASSNGYPGTNTLSYSCATSGGTTTFTMSGDIVWTASGGNLGASTTGRYFSIYDDTPTSPLDPLMCKFDYGATFTVASTETMTLDFGASLWTLV